MSRPDIQATPVEWARWYASELKWPVFPVVAGKKKPLTKNGFHDATTDPKQIAAWWKQWPQANIGTPTGERTNVLVFDVDIKEWEGKRGDETLRELEATHGPLPSTLKMWTWSGSYQLFFVHNPAIINRVGAFGEWLDSRSQGGYTILPPSQVTEGSRTGQYHWDGDPLAPLVQLPEWLAEVHRQVIGAPAIHHSASLGLGENIPNGTRNATFFSLGRSMRAKGWSEAAIKSAMETENTTRCVPPLGASEVATIVASVMKQKDRDDFTAPTLALVTPFPGTVTSEYPEPQPLAPALPPVPAFNSAMLPPAIATWVYDIADGAQCPVDYVAASFVVAVSSVIGRQIVVYPKQHDEGFRVIPNLWGGVVGPPGVMKTLAQSEPLRPVRFLNARARDEHSESMRKYKSAIGEYKLREQALKKKISTALVKDSQSTEAKQLIAELTKLHKPLRPIRRVFTINDVTVEKLGELLRDNPNGVLVFRDELHGLLSAMDKQGHEGERDFYNQAWNGNEPFDLARIGRGEVFIPAVCASILGGIQPDVLSHYFEEAFSGDRNDGFIQRLQVLVYPNIRRHFKLVDRKRLGKIYHHVTKLVTLMSDLPGHGFTPQDDAPFPLHFDADAQAFFYEWWANLENYLRSDTDHPVLIGHFAKYRSLFPSLAVIFHLLETVENRQPTAINLRAAQMAAAWCAYLDAHARRVYSLVTSGHGTASAVLHLGAKIKAGDLPEVITLRLIERKHWEGLSDREAILAALAELEDAGWIIPVAHKPARGPAPEHAWKMNPKLTPKTGGETRNLSPLPTDSDENDNPSRSSREEKERKSLSIYLNSLDGTPFTYTGKEVEK